MGAAQVENFKEYKNISVVSPAQEWLLGSLLDLASNEHHTHYTVNHILIHKIKKHDMQTYKTC